MSELRRDEYLYPPPTLYAEQEEEDKVKTKEAERKKKNKRSATKNESVDMQMAKKGKRKRSRPNQSRSVPRHFGCEELTESVGCGELWVMPASYYPSS